jgi:hypothetical protein
MAFNGYLRGFLKQVRVRVKYLIKMEAPVFVKGKSASLGGI